MLPLLEVVRYDWAPIEPPEECKPLPWLKLPACGAGPLESALTYLCMPWVMGCAAIALGSCVPSGWTQLLT
jgi:hypothetical protein